MFRMATAMLSVLVVEVEDDGGLVEGSGGVVEEGGGGGVEEVTSNGEVVCDSGGVGSLEGPCGGECGVILKSLLQRISDLEGVMDSLRKENRVLRSEAPKTPRSHIEHPIG